MEAIGGVLPPFSGGGDPVNIEGMLTIAQSLDVNDGENLVGAVEFGAQ